jgi:glycosyltransferase involved in cell wall biosynthesis
MRIGIDVSQVVYEKTGVGRYVMEMVKSLITRDQVNHYLLFGASWGKHQVLINFFNQMKLINPDVKFILIPIPLWILDLIWNRLHVLPVEWLIGKVDVFWSSDWVQPPLRQAIGITTVHDLSFMRFPKESNNKISNTHKRRLKWVIKECQRIFCDSEATKQDVIKYLQIDSQKLDVVYPGYSL